MALRVRPARDRHADEVHRGRLLGAVGVPAEHHRPDLARADPSGLVERDRERLPRVLERRDVREQRSRVEVHRVPAGRLHERNAGTVERLGEVLGRADPVPQVVLVDALLQPLRDRLEVSAGETAVRDVALGEDEEVAAALGEVVVLRDEHPADQRGLRRLP